MQETFIRELRSAYNHLYEWTVLRKSPLVKVFGLENSEDASRSLGDILRDAIEAIKPKVGKNKASRVYQLLYVRYIEQLSQHEAATDLGLSLRHLRREETLALEAVGTYLWDRYHLEKKWRDSSPTDSKPGDDIPAEAAMPDRHSELEWLQQSTPYEPVRIQDLIREVLALSDAAIQKQMIHVEFNLSENLPLVTIKRILIRQALLGIVNNIASVMPGGTFEFNAEVGLSELSIIVNGFAPADGTIPHFLNEEQITMLKQLIELSGGTLSIGAKGRNDAHIEAVISLPARDMVKVMVVDDNHDTLQFIERCLTGTRYLFIPVNDPEKTVETAVANLPQLIILDVMLPKIDGWDLLGRLQIHPKLKHIPVVVFSILPQDQIAKDLGAMAFIKKPVSRVDLLAFLDQNLDRFSRESNQTR